MSVMTPSRLLATRNEFAVIWMRFVQRFQRDANSEIWVIEGKDDIDYFSLRIETIYGAPPGRNILVAEGKSNLLRLRSQISQSKIYDKAKIAFFVDKDFDEPTQLEGRDTYITPCYSVENFYLSAATVERFFTERLQLYEEEDREEIQRVVQRFISWRDETTETLLPYCALMKLTKGYPDQFQELIVLLRDKIYIDVVHLKTALNGLQIEILISPDDLRTRHLHSTAIKAADIQSVVDTWTSLLGNDSYKAVRGKFLTPLLLKAIQFVLEDSNRRNNHVIFRRRRHCAHQLREAELLASLSRFAETPECLIRFLKKLALRWRSGSIEEQLALA